MKCEHYCPGCAMGHCPKMKVLEEENHKLKSEIVRLTTAREDTADAAGYNRGDGASGE